MERLPIDIVINILDRLPVKSVMICRCVCRSWKQLTTDPSFIRRHLIRTRSLHQPQSNFLISNLPNSVNNIHATPLFNLQYNQTLHRYTYSVVPYSESEPNFHALRMVGSCNGLICLVGYDYRRIYVSNPFTRSEIQLPDPDPDPTVDFSFDSAVGFGFVPRRNQYKVIIIRNVDNDDDDEDGSYRAEVRVFTLGLVTNIWRRLGYIPCKVTDWERCPKQVFVNGALHWLSRWFPNNLDVGFIAFNVANEAFRAIPLPKVWFENSPSLGVLYGCLSLTGFANTYNGHAEIWVMKEYGDPRSWIKCCYVYFPDLGLGNQLIVRTICLHGDGELLMLYHLGVLVACNVRTGRIRRITFDEVPLPFNFEVIEHVPTLVSPFNLLRHINGD